MKKLCFAALAIAMLWGAYEFFAQFATLGDLAGITQPEAPVRRAPSVLRGPRGPRTSLAAMPPGRLPGPRTEFPRAADPLPRAAAAEIEPTMVVPDTASAAREIAEAFVNSQRGAWNLQEYHELRPEVYQTPAGNEVRYTVYQNGIPIVGMDIRVGVSTDQQVGNVQNNYSAVRPADLAKPTLDYSVILDRYSGRYSIDEASTSGVSKVLYLTPGSDQPELSYVVPVQENGDGRRSSNVVFRASDGQILGRQFPRAEF